MRMQTLKDYLAGRTIRKEDPEDTGYWVGYVRTGLLSDMSLADYQSYNGKYKVHRTFDQIDELVPHLIELLKAKKISCFKYKSRDTPIKPKYADKLPPVFIYTWKKRRANVDADLDRLGLEDRVWIDDTKQRINYIVEAANNPENWIPVEEWEETAGGRK